MSSYKKRKRSKIKKKNKSRSRTAFKKYNKNNKLLKNSKWDILIHASNPYAMEKIALSGALKVPENNINVWLNKNYVKEAFGDYFKQDNYRYKVIELLAKNSSHLDTLKNEKVKNLQKIPDVDEESVDWIYTPGIYTNYIFDGIKSYVIKHCWAFGCIPSLVFGISSKILKERPWIACPKMMFGNCIYGDNNDLFLSSKGNLKKMPSESLAYIKKTINSKPSEYYDLTHEIIFDEIPLKYVNVIYVTPKFYDQAKKYFPNIPIKIFPEDRSDYEALLKPFSK